MNGGFSGRGVLELITRNVSNKFSVPFFLAGFETRRLLKIDLKIFFPDPALVSDVYSNSTRWKVKSI